MGIVSELRNLLEIKFDSEKSKLNALKNKNLILDLKEPVKYKGETYNQIKVIKIEKSGDKFRLNSNAFDTEWVSSMEELINQIDWEKTNKRGEA